MDDGQDRRRTEIAGKGMVRRINDISAVQHRGLDPADIVAVRIMTVIMNDHVRIRVLNGTNQLSDPFRGAESAMVLDAEQDLVACYIKNLADLFHVILIRMLRPGRETDRWFEDLTGPLDFFEHRLHIGDVVHEIKHPPDIYILCKLFHRQPDHVLRIGTIPKQIHPPAEGLKHGVRHLLPHQFQLQKRVNLLPQNIDMN